MLDADDIDSYLESIATRCCDSTVRSHRVTCKQFRKWAKESAGSEDQLNTNHLREFLDAHRAEWHETTLMGKAAVLANLLHFLTGERPSRELRPWIGNTHKKAREVESLVSYLREYRYGSREHVLVEIILDCASHMNCICKINLDHVDASSQRLEIPASSKVVIDRPVEYRISSELSNALDHYIEHERPSTGSAEPEPLITTIRGRISKSTVARSISKACDEAPNVSRVTPNDIRQAALTKD